MVHPLISLPFKDEQSNINYNSGKMQLKNKKAQLEIVIDNILWIVLFVILLAAVGYVIAKLFR